MNDETREDQEKRERKENHGANKSQRAMAKHKNQAREQSDEKRPHAGSAYMWFAEWKIKASEGAR